MASPPHSTSRTLFFLPCTVLCSAEARACLGAQHSPFSYQTLNCMVEGEKPKNNRKVYCDRKLNFSISLWSLRCEVTSALYSNVTETKLRNRSPSIAPRDPNQEVAHCPFLHPNRCWTKLSLAGNENHSLVYGTLF